MRTIIQRIEPISPIMTVSPVVETSSVIETQPVEVPFSILGIQLTPPHTTGCGQPDKNVLPVINSSLQVVVGGVNWIPRLVIEPPPVAISELPSVIITPEVLPDIIEIQPVFEDFNWTGIRRLPKRFREQEYL